MEQAECILKGNIYIYADSVDPFEMRHMYIYKNVYKTRRLIRVYAVHLDKHTFGNGRYDQNSFTLRK